MLLLQSATLPKILQIIVLSIVKLFIAPPVSLETGFSYFETIGITAIGGIIGIFIFYHLSGYIIRFYKRYVKHFFRQVFRRFREQNGMVTTVKTAPYKKASLFQSKVWLKKIQKKWGLPGICIFTFFAIPLVSFFAYKYYGKNRFTLVYLSGSVIMWSFIITTLYFFVFNTPG